MRLTELKIKNTKPKEKKFNLTDGKGLYLVVMPNGSKLWRWNYRVLGKGKTMSFGTYPETSLSAARDDHREARQMLRAGTDPMAQRKDEKKQERSAHDNSFKSVATTFFDHWKLGKDAKYVARISEALDRDVYPFIGHMPISSVEAPEIVKLARRIEERGAEDTARRMLGKVSEVFRYGIAHGIVARNPAADFMPSDVLKPVEVINFARVEIDELPELLRKIEVYRGVQRIRLGLKLLALTFLRTHELIGGRWSEINFKDAEWRIPADRMKKTVSRSKFKAPHIIPLATQTIEILEQLHTLTGDNELMFPGEWDKTKTISNNTFLQALYRMGYKGTMTGHGFRGVASTILHEERSNHGFLHEHIELQLAHIKQDDESAAYDYSKYLRERREMMQWWADYLDKARRTKSKLVA
jgi:integrase